MGDDFPTPVRGSPATRGDSPRTQILGRPITSENVLRVLGLMCFTAASWLLKLSWDRMAEMERRQNEGDGRMIRMEERQGSIAVALSDLKSDIKDVKRAVEKHAP